MDRLISQLIALQEKPAPFTPGEPLFWNDPHISSQTLGLKAGASLLDLGCGPGLYASRFSRAGFRVTGVDYSRRSIEYAANYAKDNHLDISYRYENFLDLKDDNLYDVAF